MKPAAFRYRAVASVEEALACKAEHGDDAKFLAGGQSLVPAMNFRLAQPAVLIDLNALGALDYIRAGEGGAGHRIGALTRYRTLERDRAFAQAQPLMAEALPHVAHPQIRNRGTLGGNLAHADPASELPAVMLALGARLHARSAKAERWIDAQAFFAGALTTALADDEMLAEIEVPPAPGRTGTSFLEVARRRGDFALLGVACMVTLAADDTCDEARIALCSAGPTPMLATRAARTLAGQRLDDDEALRAAGVAASEEADPLGNVHASVEFQRHLAGVLTRRALGIAGQRAKAQGRT